MWGVDSVPVHPKGVHWGQGHSSSSIKALPNHCQGEMILENCNATAGKDTLDNCVLLCLWQQWVKAHKLLAIHCTEVFLYNNFNLGIYIPYDDVHNVLQQQ